MKKKILFVNDEMTIGGVSRILNTLLKNLNHDKYELDLLVLNPHGEMMKEVPENVNLIYGSGFFATVDKNLSELLKSRDIRMIFNKFILLFYMKTGLIKSKIVRERKKLLKKNYDVEFSAKEGFCTIFIANGDAKLKYNWVQVDYEQSNYSRNHMKLMKQALSEIDLNIACSNQTRDSYKHVFGIDNVITIHNLLNTDKVNNMKQESHELEISDDSFNMITVARFHKQKSLDRLLISYSELLKDGKNVCLYIIGDGEEKESLYALAKKLEVFESVEWLGFRTNPYTYMKDMDLFVMTSRYEGYPTIVIESLLSGLPVLSTDVAGVSEQIVDDAYGWIVENDQDAITEKLSELADRKDVLKDMKSGLSDYEYENEEILFKIEELLDK